MKVVTPGRGSLSGGFPRKLECYTCGAVLEVELSDIVKLSISDSKYKAPAFVCPECACDNYLTHARRIDWSEPEAAPKLGPKHRGTPERPCEYCGQTTKGNTLHESWYRCNGCGEPSK